MCHQHDTEIEIHNDMIQMLEDANEANIALEAEQMRLKKDVRDKNVVIRHLKTISSRQCYDPSYAPMLVAMLVAMLMTIAGRSPLGYRVVPRPTLFRVSLCSPESYR